MSMLMEHWIYLIPLAVVAYVLWGRRGASAGEVKALLARGAQVVDVRTKAEFRAAAHPKALNIPLDELEAGLKQLDPAKPVLVCCASGSRSGVAVGILKRKGFQEVLNLGPWNRLSSLLG